MPCYMLDVQRQRQPYPACPIVMHRDKASEHEPLDVSRANKGR